MPFIIVIVLVVALFGCGPPSTLQTHIDTDAFDLELVQGAKWKTGTGGFDPSLPGYRLSGGIGTIKLTRIPGMDVSPFSVEIWTSPANSPHLDMFSFAWGDTLVRTPVPSVNDSCDINARNSEGQWKTIDQRAAHEFFNFQIRDSAIEVAILPAALRLVKRECTISWIDWYRR